MQPHKYAQIQGAGQVRRISLSNELDAPIDRVWTSITQIEHLRHWWPDWQPGGVLEGREGGRICLDTGAWINGVIKVWRPPHIVEFTWQESIIPEPDWFEPNTSSLLRMDLVELTDTSTLLHLIQFAPESSVVGGTAGWHQFAGERLAAYLKQGVVIDDPQRFEQLTQLYEEEGSA